MRPLGARALLRSIFVARFGFILVLAHFALVEPVTSESLQHHRDQNTLSMPTPMRDAVIWAGQRNMRPTEYCLLQPMILKTRNFLRPADPKERAAPKCLTFFSNYLPVNILKCLFTLPLSTTMTQQSSTVDLAGS